MHPDDVDALDWDRAESLWVALGQIEAQETLLAFTVGDYPHLRERARAKTFHKYHKLAYPSQYDSSEVLSTRQLHDRLKAVIDG